VAHGAGSGVAVVWVRRSHAGTAEEQHLIPENVVSDILGHDKPMMPYGI